MPEEKAQQKKEDFVDMLAKQGYNYYYISSATEDLNNSNANYITIGFVDANGRKQIFITLPKEEMLARCEATLKKYKK
jgi:hypothetical protein